MDSEQHYYITPPTIFLPEDGLKIAFIGTDSDWVEEVTDNLENTFPSIPMTFYHLESTSKSNWQWLYLMVEQSDLVMVNAAIATEIEMIMAVLNIGNKAWFYVEPELVDSDMKILLNTINANTFSSTEQLHNMLKAFLGNG